MGDNGPMLRNALADALRSKLDFRAPGKFIVLYPEEVDEDVARSKADLSKLGPQDIAAARKLLKGFDFHVGIVGTFGIKKLNRVASHDTREREDGTVFVSAFAPV